MSTTRLTIVTAARNHVEDRILTGVFGFTREDGTFEVDASLKDRIYMFSLMASNPLPGLQTQTLEIDDEHANALRATLTAALGRRWAQAYAQVTGHHELAQAEAKVVSNAVASAIASMAQPAYRVTMTKPFKAVQAEYVAEQSPDEDGNDWGEENTPISPAHYRIRASNVVNQTAGSSWTVAAAQPLVISNAGVAQTEADPAAQAHANSADVNTNYASGVVKASMVVYGETEQARKAVIDAIDTLPMGLLDELYGKDALSVQDLTWHTPQEMMAMVRERVVAGQPVSVQEMALLSPHEDQRSRLIWAEGVLAARALAQAPADDEINLEEAADSAAPIPRM